MHVVDLLCARTRRCLLGPTPMSMRQARPSMAVSQAGQRGHAVAFLVTRLERRKDAAKLAHARLGGKGPIWSKSWERGWTRQYQHRRDAPAAATGRLAGHTRAPRGATAHLSAVVHCEELVGAAGVPGHDRVVVDFRTHHVRGRLPHDRWQRAKLAPPAPADPLRNRRTPIAERCLLSREACRTALRPPCRTLRLTQRGTARYMG